MFRRISSVLRPPDFKYPDCRIPQKLSLQDKFNNYYYGHASAYDVVHLVKSWRPNSRLIRAEMRVGSIRKSGAMQTISAHHYILVVRNNIFIPDPRSIFAPGYDPMVFKAVPPIIDGPLDDFCRLNPIIPDYWASQYVQLYHESIINSIIQGDDGVTLYFRE